MYVHTPLITGSDCEGAGEMFQVTTLDLKDVQRVQTEALITAKISLERDESDSERTAQRRDICTGIQEHLYIWTDIPCRELQHDKTCGRVLDDRA